MRQTRFLQSSRLVLLLLVGGAHAGAAQQLRGHEAGIQGLVLVQDPVWAGGAVYGAWRPGGGARFSLGLGLGSTDGEVSGRGEVLAHFLLSPERSSGIGPYAFGGAAVVTGSRHQGYLVLGLGLEERPGARSGWFAEGGVGGGARIAAGWRWRRLVRPVRGGS
jgi:hypothetical protein